MRRGSVRASILYVLVIVMTAEIVLTVLTTLMQKKNLVLKSAHPSPLSASRGFLGNEHFKKANAWLRERYGEDGGVDWTVLK